MTDRPNIVFLLCDQLRADVIGAYGHPFARTPAMDALGADGVRFDSAYVASPVCVPSRGAMLSGREPQNTGCYENGTAMSGEPTFIDELTAHGYRTHGVGKMHFTPDPQASMGFQTRDRGEEFGTPETDDYFAHVAESGYEYVEHPHGLRDEMYYIPQLSPVPEELHFSRWVADRSIDFLDRHRDEAGDQPFFLWSSFIAPHPPFAPPSPWHRMYAPSLMPDPHEPAGSPGLLTVYNRLQNRYKFRDGGRDRRLDQLIRAYYLASVSYVDHQIGRILSALEERGLRENTVVVLTSDHGEFLGDYGAYGKRSFLDAAARVPLVCAGPGFTAGASEDPVSLVDLRATFLAAAGIDGDIGDGTRLQDPRSQRVVYGQYQQGPLGVFAVIGPRWKYIWSAPDRREYLIDRVADPRESSNLAYNVRLRRVLAEQRRLAREHFRDLESVDLEAESANVRLNMGAASGAEASLGLDALDRDRDAATLVVQHTWADELPAGYVP